VAHPKLDNLVLAGLLDAEPTSEQELDALLDSARTRLNDAGVPGLSIEGSFDRAYQAAHVLSLAALRWHGYRPKNRAVTFQALEHTVGWPPAKWRVLSLAHTKRNAVQYDAVIDVEKALVDDVVRVTAELLKAFEKLGKPPGG
jgi:hypothetical protein